MAQTLEQNIIYACVASFNFIYLYQKFKTTKFNVILSNMPIKKFVVCFIYLFAFYYRQTCLRSFVFRVIFRDYNSFLHDYQSYFENYTCFKKHRSTVFLYLNKNSVRIIVRDFSRETVKPSVFLQQMVHFL